jgi:hypothetical protein
LAIARAQCYREIGLEEIAAVFDYFSAELRDEASARIPVGR